MNIEIIISWFLNFVVLILIIKSILLRIKSKKIIKNLENIHEERKKYFDEFIENWNERLNLLSRENNKLREQNEELKERLRDLGFKDFDVLN